MSSSLSLMSYIPSSSRRVNKKYDKEMNSEIVLHQRPFANGGYGSIYTCEYRNEKLVAKKINLHASGFIDKPFEPLIMGCNIPYVNEYRRVFFDKEAMYIIQDVGTSMRGYRRNILPSYNKLIRWFKMLLIGCKHIHRYGIIHGDIKPDNILLFPDGDMKLSDMGLACISRGSYERYIGTASYRPPEVWSNSTRTTKTDIWCLGLTIYYLINGNDLFSLKISTDDKNIRNNEYKLLLNEWSEQYNNRNMFKMYHPLSGIIHSMLHPNPDKRPSCSEILKDPLFNDIIICKDILQEIHVESFEDIYAGWIYNLLCHKFRNREEGLKFSSWFIEKIMNGHHIDIPEGLEDSYHLYERWLVSNTCHVPKFIDK